MKARKPDGSRWFTPTTAEVMDRWLAEPELLDWLRRTREFSIDGDGTTEQQMAELAAAVWREFFAGVSIALRRRARRKLH